MSRLTRLLLCLLSLGFVLPVALLVAAAPAQSLTTGAHPAARHPLVGIGDGKPDLFKDPRFLALGIKNVRYDMPWDTMSDPVQRAQATRWLNAAKAAGMSVLVTIDHSRRVIYKHVPGKKKLQPFGQSRVLPTTAAYVKAFRAIRARFPWVTQFATWDETN